MSDDLEKLKQLLDVDSPPKVSIDNVKKSSKRKIIKRSTYLISGIASVSASLLLFVVFFKNHNFKCIRIIYFIIWKTTRN